MKKLLLRGLINTVDFTLLYMLPVGIYLLKVSIRNTRTRCEIFSKLTIKIPEWVFEKLKSFRDVVKLLC